MSLLDDALADYARHLSTSTKKSYAYAVKRYTDFAGADPQNWTHESAQAFYDALIKTVSVSTANDMIRDVRSISRHLAATRRDNTLLFAEHVRRARKKRAIQTKVKAYGPEQARALLRACYGGAPADLRDRAIVVLGFCTGMRRMSLAGIRFEDFQRGSLDIDDKGGGRIRIPLSERCSHALSPWVQWLDDSRGYFFRRLRKPKVDGTVGAAERLTVGGLSFAVCERARSVGLYFHPHIFRHTFVTMGKVAGVSNPVLATITGHLLGGASQMLDGIYLDHSQLHQQAMQFQDRILESIT